MKTFTKAHKLAAVLTATALTTKAGAAFATDFSTVSDNIVNSSRSLPNLVSTVAYVGGIGLGVAGVFKLKQHVDNPGQVMMKDGLVRLGAGGGLLALPFVTDAMTGTISDGATAKGPEFNDLKFGEVSTD